MKEVVQCLFYDLVVREALFFSHITENYLLEWKVCFCFCEWMFLFVSFCSYDFVNGATLFFIKKETLAQVFSCEFCEISKNTFSYRTPPVAASGLRVFVASIGYVEDINLNRKRFT